MRHAIILLAILLVHQLAKADPEAPSTAAAKNEQQFYSPISAEPFRPTFTLAANSDGVITGRLGLGYSWDRVGTINPRSNDVPVNSFTLGPTVGLSYNGRKGLFSVGTDKKGAITPNYGESTFNIGFLFAYSSLSIATSREFDYMVPERAAKAVAVDTCKKLCSGSVEMENRDFCDTFTGGTSNPVDYDYSEFCPDGKVAFKKELAKLTDKETKESWEEQLLEIRASRYRFPVMDLSLWGGGGAAKFDYYDMTADAGTTPTNYMSMHAWKPSGGLAAQFTWVPVTTRKVGFTLEIPVVWKQSYQGSQVAGTACSVLGVLASGGTLSSCDDEQPVGAPLQGSLVSADVYAGMVDRRDGKWRLALGIGYRRDVLTSTNVVAIKLPFFINAGLLGAKEDKGNKLPVHVQYDGIIRIMPSFQIFDSPNQPTGWSFLINLELLGNRNLFTRADALYK